MKTSHQFSVAIGDRLELPVEKLLFRGVGLGRWRGMAVMVPRSAPGDLLRVRVTAVRRDYLEAEIEEVLSSSPERSLPFCPDYPCCGGCQWQHLTLEGQRKWKELILAELLRPLSRGGEVSVSCLFPVSPPRGYRTRAQVKVGEEGNRVRLGFFRPRSHILVEIDTCPLLDSHLDALLTSLREMRYPDLKQLFPRLKEVRFQKGFPEGKILLTLVTPTASRPSLRLLYHRLKEASFNLAGIALAWGMGPTVHDHVGDGWTEVWVGGIGLRVGPTSFCQVGEQGAEAILRIIQDWMEPRGIASLLDLYCGVGTFCLPFAARGVKTVGVESCAEAASLAKSNAERNGIRGVKIMHSSAEEALSEGWRHEKYDLVLVDPPRPGISKRAMQGLLSLSPRHLIYISCDPSTLCRDMLILQEAGYQYREIQPLDLFPHTYHLETVVWMEKKESKPMRKLVGRGKGKGALATGSGLSLDNSASPDDIIPPIPAAPPNLPFSMAEESWR